MDLKYNLALAWLLRDRSPLPITTLEVIKDSPEFCYLPATLSFLVFSTSRDRLKGRVTDRHKSWV